MKSLLTTLLLITLINSINYSQFEFNNRELTGSLFRGEDFIFEHSQRLMEPATLDSIINSIMEIYHIPGLTALIVKHDSIVWSRNYGYANIALNKPVEDSTLFLMASISKTIMVTAIMQLWEDGLFQLEDNINDYLQPDFQVHHPNYPNDTITFKMLMTHTSSIDENSSFTDPLRVCGDSPISLDSFFVNYFTPGGIYYSPANFLGYSPNANIWHYSNVGACLLAYLIVKLSGIPFDQYCRENIFNPLEMDSSTTSWFLSGLDTTNIATPYEWNGSQYVALCHQGWPLYPVAFLRTNKLDLEHFLLAYMNWGTYNGTTILNSTTIDTMLTIYKFIPPNYLPMYAQGLIWGQALFNQNYLWGHGGKWPGAATGMFFNETDDWGLIMFFNKRQQGPEYDQIISVIIEYAKLFGDIYAVNTKLNNPYLNPMNDSIIVRSEFSNFNQHEFTANAIYINSDSSSVDSIALYDDGLHGDSLANDGIWGGFIHSIAEEDYFDLGISTIDIENGKYFYSENLTKFTTVGPVVLYAYEITSNDTTPGAGDIINYVLTLQNQSSEQTAMNISTTLKSLDTLYQVTGLVNYGNIGPGETSVGTSYHTITFGNQVPHNTLLPVEIRIASDSILYWIDTLDIITDVKEFASLPNEYSLSQNFPNPFNPITTIQFSIPSRSNVVLKFYDILGNEVTTLVNEEKEQGVYIINFDANNLASGVYFYQLKAGNYLETKKMVLMK